MPLLNDLKKLLFGVKAVSKSATEKAIESSKETGKELLEEGAQFLDKMQNKVEGLGQTILDKAEQVANKASEWKDDMGEKIQQIKEEVKDNLNPTDPDYQPSSQSNDIMDEIIAEAKNTTPDEETLELRPLSSSKDMTADQQDALDQIREKAARADEKITESTTAAMEKAGDFFENVGKKALDTGNIWAEKLGETAEKTGKTILQSTEDIREKAANFTEEVGRKVLEAGSKVGDKLEEAAFNTGEALLNKSSEGLEKAKGFAENIGDGILKAKDQLLTKTEEVLSRASETTDNLMEKLKTLNQKLEDKISGNNQQFADKPLNTGGSELNKHEGFWEKAEKFAKGDYHGTRSESPSGEMKIQKDPQHQPNSPSSKIKGFDDTDGDGDSLVDDAIIEK